MNYEEKSLGQVGKIQDREWILMVFQGAMLLKHLKTAGEVCVLELPDSN